MEQTESQKGRSDRLDKLYSIAVIVVATLIITYFHYGVPEHHTVVHISHYYAFYIIVIYAAYKFGMRGGFIVSVFLTVIYSPASYIYALHLSFPHHILPSMVEVSMVYAVALIAGYFAGKLKKEKQKVEKVSAEMLTLERQLAHDDRLRVLGQLSAGIAHEIRNPLAAIKAGISLIKSGKGNDQVTDILSSEIDRLNVFVERFLQYARFDVGKKEPFELSGFLNEFNELAKLAASRKSIKINTNAEIPDGLTVNGDKNSLKQALLNIIVNAVEVSTEIYISADADDKYVIFKIEDNGGGIPAENLEKIFEPFFTTKADGTGLGLALAAKIAQEHGGGIKAENTGNGCLFTLKVEK